MGEIKIEVPKEDFENPDNLMPCECGNWTHHKYISGSEFDTCPSCAIDFLEELLNKMFKIFKETADPDLSKEQLTLMIKQQYAEISGVTIEELEEMNYFEDIEF